MIDMQTMTRINEPALFEADGALNSRRVCGVRFRRSRRLLLCDARDHSLRPGDYAVVQTSAGPELARVTLGTTSGSAESNTQNRYVLHKATNADLDSMRDLVLREVEVRRDFFGAAAAEQVQVSAVRVDYRYDGGALRIKFRSGTKISDTGMRERLALKYGAGFELRNLGAPKELGLDTGCGGGSCSSCPSNGMRERAGAVVPHFGRVRAGHFTS